MGDSSGRAGPFSACLVTGLVLALVLWLCEALFGSPPDGSTTLASFFFLLLVLVPASLSAAVFFAVVGGDANPYERLGTVAGRFWSYLVQRDGEAGFRLLNGVLWLGLYGAVAVVAGYLLNREIALEIVRARYQAILAMAATVGTFAVLLPIPLFGLALGRRLAPTAARLPGIAALWRRPLLPAGVLLLGLAAALTAFLVHFHEAVEAAPWQVPTLLVGALLLALALGGLLTATFHFRVATVLTGTLLVLLTLASAVAALGLDRRATKARRYFQQAPATRLSYALVTRLFDRDGDGFMHAFAGGDCAPDDPTISPVAIDIPGNGLDEDCNGADLEFTALERGRWDYPVPEPFADSRLPVILVTADALAGDRVGFMDYDRGTTPNLDRLAEGCVVFEKAFSHGPSTRLSLAATMTGLYDTQVHRGEGRKVPYPLQPENVTLAEIFRDNGYETVFVSPNAYFHSRWKGFLQGFDVVDKSGAARTMKGPVHNADKMTKAAIRQVKKKRKKPLFLWVHYYDMHPPFARPEGGPDLGKGRLDLYDSEVAWWDKYADELFFSIDQQFRKDGYLLIVSADHGSAFDANHRKHSHGYDLHTAVLHVPMLFCSRELAPRRVEETPVSLLDLAPTLVNLAGLESDVPFEGTSLVPLLFEEIEWPDRLLFHQFYLAEKVRKGQDPLYAASVRSGTLNYLWDRRENEYFLYRYDLDPEENRNLVESEPEAAHEMDSILKTWLYRVRNEHMKGHFQTEDGHDDGGPDEDDSLAY